MGMGSKKITNKKQKIRYKFLAATLAVVMLFTGCGNAANAKLYSDALEKSKSTKKETEEINKLDKNNYYYYLQKYKDKMKPDKKVEVNIKDFILEDGKNTAITKDEIKDGIYITQEAGSVTWTINVAESGLYNLEVDYKALINVTTPITVGVLIDGKSPYTEANACILTRSYTNGGIRENEFGDDLTPILSQQENQKSQFIKDQVGAAGELYFYFEEGVHQISLNCDGTEFVLNGLRLTQMPYKSTYSDYISLLMQDSKVDSKGYYKEYEAENYIVQSDSSLIPLADRSNPYTQPFDYDHLKLNYGGGGNWSSPGQWIEWEFDVPEDGYYNVGFKFKQDYIEGLFSSRRIFIDGEVPFKELDSVAFEYDTNWQIKQLGEDSPYKIYLKKGKHTIRMENVVGDLGETIKTLQNCVEDLNDLYISIMMVTGTDPDKFRDFYLDRVIPGIEDRFLKNAKILFDEANRLIEIVGKRGKESAFFEDIAYKLESYAKDIESLTSKGRLKNFKNDLSSLSSKVSGLTFQGLALDYFIISSPGAKMPKVNPSLWEWIKFNFGTFFASFKADRVEKAKENSIKVWVQSGSDQLQLIKDMIADDFTPKTGINVEIELVQGTLIEATIANQGPNIALNVPYDTPVNFALRGALEDLSQFDGFNELKKEFLDGAFNPYTLDGNVYAIPGEQKFNMMFVRTDIFEKLGLEVPETWDDLFDIAPIIQRNNLEIGIGDIYTSILSQMGGQLYNDKLTEIQLGENVSIEAFKMFTGFYSEYDFPLTFDFVNRFRTGEMPIGIYEYNTYNMLMYAAPEIKGLWKMYPIPGIKQEDGTIDYTQSTGGEQVSIVTKPATATGSIMFKGAENPKACWEFLEWWGSGEIQAKYAQGIESLMGPAARIATPNMKAFEKLAWNKSEREILQKQMNELNILPVLPGNYYVTRGITNSFRGVVYDKKNVRELLTKWEKEVNKELERKRKEFYKNN